MNKLKMFVGVGEYVAPTLGFYTVNTVSVIATSDEIEAFSDEEIFTD